ncbi:DUF7537 family lipoprotein [Halocatena marina]|uniref:DUF7537 family lipoprotein n=1 Tax=Halocatena marina TaxID=2934937 RepID=UPI004038FD15
MSQNLGLRLCLVVLLCLSGCNAFNGGSTETASITPAGVPTDDPNATRGLAPGLTNHGVVDSIALGDAHEAVLSNTSFTIHGKTTVKYSNGTLRRQGERTARVVNPRDRRYINVSIYTQNKIRSDQKSTNNSFWSNGERVLVALSSSQTNSTTYQHFESRDPQYPILKYHPQKERYYTLFQAVDTKVINHTTNNGTTLYRLTSTEIADSAQLIEYSMNVKIAQNPRNLTFHAVIDSRGVVHEYRLAYTATLTETNPSTSVRVVSTTRYTKMGSTTVDRPSWYAKANNTTPEPPTTYS